MASPLPARRASRAACRLRSSVGRNKSTDKTTAASPLTGWNPVCMSRSAAVNPIEVSNHLMRMSMTLPARVPSAYHSNADTQLPMQNPPALDSAAVLAALVARPLTDGAFKIAAAMLVLSSSSLRWLDLPEVASTAGMTEGRARQFLGELVRARVIQRQKQLVYRDDKPTARNRYALVVTA